MDKVESSFSIDEINVTLSLSNLEHSMYIYSVDYLKLVNVVFVHLTTRRKSQ